jgi:hypothetical protein
MKLLATGMNASTPPSVVAVGLASTVAVDPAVDVTPPVNAGICAAANIPELISEAPIDLFVSVCVPDNVTTFVFRIEQSLNTVPTVLFQHARSLRTVVPGPDTPPVPDDAIVMLPPVAVIVVLLPATRFVACATADAPVALARIWPLVSVGNDPPPPPTAAPLT